MAKIIKDILFIVAGILFLVSIAGCAHRSPVHQPFLPQIKRMGYTIQVGAFSKVDNASGLTRLLEDSGLNAYYFRHPSDLYKVRFGNFPSYASALAKAKDLKTQGVIDAYYIVRPDQYAISSKKGQSVKALRKDLVKTATGFIGIPYQWGGTSADKGFDCSGLAMAVYRFNGLDLPRTSRQQFHEGVRTNRHWLRPGDLVFFSTSGGRKVSHVGIYVGDNTFIHAPGTGHRICRTSLSADYYKRRYVGARTYIR